MMVGLFWNRMYTDWTAVACCFTTVPLLAVVATAAFFIWQQKKKQQLRFDFHRQAALGRLSIATSGPLGSHPSPSPVPKQLRQVRKR